MGLISQNKALPILLKTNNGHWWALLWWSNLRDVINCYTRTQCYYTDNQWTLVVTYLFHQFLDWSQMPQSSWLGSQCSTWSYYQDSMQSRWRCLGLQHVLWLTCQDVDKRGSPVLVGRRQDLTQAPWFLCCIKLGSASYYLRTVQLVVQNNAIIPIRYAIEIID